MIATPLLPALLLAAMVAEPTAAPPADARATGHYSLADSGPDVLVELRLHPDGRFEYGMIAGAVDQSAKGRWTSDGRTVTLNTLPRPRPAEFSAGPISGQTGAPAAILVNLPNGRGLEGIDIRIGFANGVIDHGYTQTDGWTAATAARPVWAELSLDMYDVPPKRFMLDAAKGSRFTFVLTPNDIGIVDFRDQTFTIDGTDLRSNGPVGAGATFRRRSGP